MLELAVCAGVMVTCLAGTFQFGYTFYVYNQLVSAVGNGARYAAQRTYRAAHARRHRPRQGGHPQHGGVRRCATLGNDVAPAVAGLKPEQVEVDWIATKGGAPEAVDVTIRDFTVNAIFKTFTFDGKPFVEFPFIGRYAPAESEP